MHISFICLIYILYDILYVEKEKWMQKSSVHTKYPEKWNEYITNFEDAKQKYSKLVANLHKASNDEESNSEQSENSLNSFTKKDSFIYADMIKNDLSIFGGKIR